MDQDVVFNADWVNEKIRSIELEMRYIRIMEDSLETPDTCPELGYQVLQIQVRLSNLYIALNKTKIALENYASRMGVGQSVIDSKVNQALHD